MQIDKNLALLATTLKITLTAMLRILLALFLLLSAKGDTAPEKRFEIYFLGNTKPTAIRAHEKFLRAIKEFEPKLLSRIVVKYIQLPIVDSEVNASLRHVAERNPDLVVAVNGFYSFSAQQVFKKTPILFASYDDPVEYGIVTDMHSRSEPICGISLADTLEGKRFEILKQAYPNIRHIAVVADRQWAEVMGGRLRTAKEAQHLGMTVSVALADSRSQVQSLLAMPDSRRADAWYIPATPIADHSADLLITQLRLWKKPSIWTAQSEAQQGAPLAYSQETIFVWRSLAELTARVYAGEYSGSIPIIRPTHFTLTVRVDPENIFPPPAISIVRRADRVIR